MNANEWVYVRAQGFYDRYMTHASLDARLTGSFAPTSEKYGQKDHWFPGSLDHSITRSLDHEAGIYTATEAGISAATEQVTVTHSITGSLIHRSRYLCCH
jgi:hypothetical protein